MAPTADEHRRTHNLLLVNNLLNQLNTTSPFTLVRDSLEQTARPLLAEYLRRAQEAKVKTVFISFETLAKPQDVDVFIQAWSTTETPWQRQVAAHTSNQAQPGRRTLLIIDSLNVLSTQAGPNLATALSTLLSPSVSLLAVLHTDIPLPASIPSPSRLLSYLATSVFTLHSLEHVLTKKAARDRSLAEPSFGLEEEVDGIMQGLGANSSTGLVLEMEHRRKSGRGIKEWFVLQLGDRASTKTRQNICLLEDYPGYRTKVDEPSATSEALSTFELGLTDKQRQDREGVVLPYYDAQKGNDEGGRILYDMGAEDDFDEEEDEI